MDAKEYLHSDIISELDPIFDPGGKQEYTEEQLVRFAEIWAVEVLIEVADKKLKELVTTTDQYGGKTRSGGLSPDTGPRV